MLTRHGPLLRALCALALLAAATPAATAGNWREFRRLVPAAVDCVNRHPGQLPKLEASVRKYQHRLSEADAVAALSPAMADQMIAKPLRELREALAQCEALDGGGGRVRRRR